MANADENLLSWVRQVRGVEDFKADSSLLLDIRSFLQAREATSVHAATHTILENYPDWWCRGKHAPPGLSLETEEDMDELSQHAGTLFTLGIPLTLAERRTNFFRFFQDIEAWGTRDVSVDVDEIMGPDCSLTEFVGKVICEVFPASCGFLDAAVYDATGLSQTKGVRKTSLRLVWPGIVVDAERAARIRDLMVHKLTTACAEEGPLAALEARLKELNPNNAWHSVFGDAAYSSRSNVRMPLSDRVSPLPLRAPERRPLAPLGVMRFSTGGANRRSKIEWLCREGELEPAEWLKIGCLRQPADVKLTEWSVPSWPGNQPIPPSSTRTGRVKVRTAGGSDGGGGLRVRASRAPPAPERAGQLFVVERRCAGSPEEFCQAIEQHLGKPTAEADGSFVWRQNDTEARVVLFAEDHRVRVVGRPSNARALVVRIAPYTEALTALGAGPGGPGPLPGGRAPSAAYAPGAATEGLGPTPPPPRGRQGDLRQGGTSDGANGDNLAREQCVNEQSALAQIEEERVAVQPFESQGQGELALECGDAVCVLHDPEGENSNGQDRWVYGRNETADQCGWFPLSHTALREANGKNQ